MNYNVGKRTSVEIIYENLSGVSIDDQMKQWDARGKGYYGEYLIFSELYKKVPGECKILMNLEVPSEHGRTTEIDLLLIHETGLYVFEAKHYKGTIYGKVEEHYWTQYFRTSSNNRFVNPIKQNAWHIEQLRKIYPTLPIHSFIVFTSSECELRVTGCLENTTLCNQYNMLSSLERVCRSNAASMSSEMLDSVFNTLKVYSPMREAAVVNEEITLDFYEFLRKIEQMHDAKMRQLDEACSAKEKEYVTKNWNLQQSYAEKEKTVHRKLQTVKGIAIGACVAFMLLCVFVSVALIAFSRLEVSAAKEELQEFKKKWQQITDFEIDRTMIKKDFILVDDVMLENVSDIEDVVKMSAVLTYNGQNYYAVIDKNSMITVVLFDGRVLEYPFYSSSYYSYSLGYSDYYKTLEIKNRELNGFNMGDVAFIKLTNLRIERLNGAYGEKSLLTDYEIVLYTAN